MLSLSCLLVSIGLAPVPLGLALAPLGLALVPLSGLTLLLRHYFAVLFRTFTYNRLNCPFRLFYLVFAFAQFLLTIFSLIHLRILLLLAAFNFVRSWSFLLAYDLFEPLYLELGLLALSSPPLAQLR